MSSYYQCETTVRNSTCKYCNIKIKASKPRIKLVSWYPSNKYPTTFVLCEKCALTLFKMKLDYLKEAIINLSKSTPIESFILDDRDYIQTQMYKNYLEWRTKGKVK